jgi:hypothetical protein
MSQCVQSYASIQNEWEKDEGRIYNENDKM